MNFKIDNKCDLLVGQFCISKSGRDKGKVYIVYEIVNEDYVLLVNGKDRTIKNPKKKNIKHLQKVNQNVKDFEKKIIEDKIKDLDIKRMIKINLEEAKCQIVM